MSPCHRRLVVALEEDRVVGVPAEGAVAAGVGAVVHVVGPAGGGGGSSVGVAAIIKINVS